MVALSELASTRCANVARPFAELVALDPFAQFIGGPSRNVIGLACLRQSTQRAAARPPTPSDGQHHSRSASLRRLVDAVQTVALPPHDAAAPDAVWTRAARPGHVIAAVGGGVAAMLSPGALCACATVTATTF